MFQPYAQISPGEYGFWHLLWAEGGGMASRRAPAATAAVVVVVVADLGALGDRDAVAWH